MLTLADVLEGVGGPRLEALTHLLVQHVVIDHRQVTRGDMFIAFTGARVDGHTFVGHALGLGANVVLVQSDINPALLSEVAASYIDVRNKQARINEVLAAPLVIRVDETLRALQRLATYWRDRHALVRVIGITGSIGKTSTKELAAQVLSERFQVLKSEGNQNNDIGVPLTLLRLTHQHDCAVLEMAMDKLGEITSYCNWAKPNVGVVTNIGPVHLEKLGSIENIALAKSELVEAIPRNGVVILNDDDERVREMRKVSHARVLSYGLTSRADIWADEIESHGLDGMTFMLHHRAETHFVRLPLLGQHSVQTALRAAAVGLAEGLSWDEIVAGLSRKLAEQVRLVVAKGPFESLVLDDSYNASAESTLAALNVLKDIDGGPRIAVLGDMFELGNAEQVAHEEVGCRAGIVADWVIGVGERARWICRAAIECGRPAARVLHANSNAEALQLLKTVIRGKSVILVKGSRGMQMEEIVEGLGEMKN